MRAVKQGDGKLIEYEVFDGRVRESQLCDLKDNPDELLVQHHDATVVALTGRKPAPFQINLAGDPRHTAKLTEMRALLLAEMRRHDDPFRLRNQPHDNLPTPPEPSAPAPKSGKAKKNCAGRKIHRAPPRNASTFASQQALSFRDEYPPLVMTRARTNANRWVRTAMILPALVIEKEACRLRPSPVNPTMACHARQASLTMTDQGNGSSPTSTQRPNIDPALAMTGRVKLVVMRPRFFQFYADPNLK